MKQSENIISLITGFLGPGTPKNDEDGSTSGHCVLFWVPHMASNEQENMCLLWLMVMVMLISQFVA